MSVDTQLILVANPGSSSRKYALYRGRDVVAELHYEVTDGAVQCHLRSGGTTRDLQVNLPDVAHAAEHVNELLHSQAILQAGEQITAIGLRVVAPSTFFMQDHLVTDEVVARLTSLMTLAPLHIHATLDELTLLRAQFADTPIVGVSDSAFHITKPTEAWNYGIDIHDADQHDIKRFGYHGLSVGAAVKHLRATDHLVPRLIVCHLGSGSSVTAVKAGESIDTTMGYSPLEGVLMATRSGTIDVGAALALRTALGISDDELANYLNTRGGLLGLGGSNDIRELRSREEAGDHLAHLALETLIYTIAKAIGQMTAALGGADMIVFTGTVGERSWMLRRRIIAKFHYLDFQLDLDTNKACEGPSIMTNIAALTQSRPIMVIPADESREIMRHTAAALHKK